MTLLTTGTLLTITPISGYTGPLLQPYSARGLTQQWEVISSGGGSGSWTRRDVNGSLRSVADTRFRKIKSVISCKDGVTPSLDDAWIGVICEVGCAFEFNYVTGGVPQHPVVSGSTRFEGSVTFYRPLLTMMVTNIKAGFQEWAAHYDWTVDLEEI